MTQTPPEFAGCLWPIDTACAGADEWAALDPALQTRAHALASATLQRLVGGRVGACPLTVRPCKPSAGWAQSHGYPYYTGYPFTPVVLDTGAWVNVGCCSTANCQCDYACSVALPPPVGRVDEVRLDGQIVPPENYTVRDNRLVWTGAGECPWPATQDLSRPDTEEGTFSVTYLNAHPVDSIGACAVGILAMEYAKAARGSNKCRLPSGVTAVVRQGVTMELTTGAFPDGVTGIREVDAFIALWNPNALQRQATVWTPDLQRPRIGG